MTDTKRSATRALFALLAGVAVTGTAACGSSSPDVVQHPGTTPPAATTATSSPASPSTAAPTTGRPAGQPAVQVVPSTELKNGQSVLVRGTGFSPAQPYTVIECAQKGNATGPGDCNVPAMLTVTADAHGVVQTRLRVLKGPFGANGIVCSATQACLISVTQASLSPTQEADRSITFAS